MVDGINITSPRVPGSSEANATAVKSVVASDNRQKTQSPDESDQVKSAATDGVSSVISKSAEKRFTALSSANVLDFLQAAEKFIDASLPNKPPGTKLRINLDSDSGRFVYQGVDINTGDVITQFPSEDILRFVAFNRERGGLEGIVVDEEA